MTTYKSDILAAVHESASDLHKLGGISNEEMNFFDDGCLEGIPEYTPERIKFIRQRDEVSQRQLALYLNVSIKTVQSWECSVPKHPSGAAAKLLQIAEKHGVQVLAG